jgi:hypothetical protein
MTPEGRAVILSLVQVPGREREGTPEDVLRHFGVTDGKKLGLRLLRDAIERRDNEDIDFALIVCGVFGITMNHLNMLIQLSSADWHQIHEKVVYQLDKLRTPAAVDALYEATQWVPDYLEWDDTRALARNAIWAIGKIPGPEAQRALERLLKSDDEILRDGAREQIERRAKAQG